MKQINDSCIICSKESTHMTCTQEECKQLCYHMYICCYDYTNGHLCKHIHRVHSIRMQVQPNHSISTLNHGLRGRPDNDSDIDPLEFAESVRDLTTGMET